MTEQEFGDVFERYYRAVLTYGLRHLDPEGARDLAAETFLIAWRRWNRVPDAPLPWLLATARRVLANELRRQRRGTALVARVADDANNSRPHAEAAEDPAEILTANAELQAALERLSGTDRELLVLVAWDGLSPTDAAKVLGCSSVTCRVRLHRARARLAEELASALPGELPIPVAPGRT